MREVSLRFTGLSTCHVITGNGILDRCPGFIRQVVTSQTAVIITDSNVGPLYANTLASGLEEAGIAASIITVPAGENSKTLETTAGLYRQLAELCADRGTTIVALGGGVVGDLAGFTAATYLRGLPLVQIPTSLLAQVDSSIGGKTGVNLDQLKNQVGVFHHAQLVISDISTLSTLPACEFANGTSEIIKSAVIADGELFTILEKSIENLYSGNLDLLENVIFRTIGIKGEIVSADEKDMSARQLLNFGHTIGHGIEAAADFSIPHGEAVACGMIAAAKISRKLELLSKNDFLRLTRLLSRAGLPLKAEGVDHQNIVNAIKHDKKIKDGKMSFVLIREPGKSLISQEVTLQMIMESILEEDG